MKHPDWSKDDMTWGELLGPAMEVETEAEAQEYLDRYCEWQARVDLKRPGKAVKTPEEYRAQALHNIGYYSGYYDSGTGSRVLKLFRTVHPIFGDVVAPTAQEAFEMGRAWGQRKPKAPR